MQTNFHFSDLNPFDRHSDSSSLIEADFKLTPTPQRNLSVQEPTPFVEAPSCTAFSNSLCRMKSPVRPQESSNSSLQHTQQSIANLSNEVKMQLV